MYHPRRWRSLSFERRFLFVVVVILSIGTLAANVGLYVESQHRCDAINRANTGNRAAWEFMQNTVQAGWVTSPPSKTQRATANAFFAGVQERLRPIKC